MKPERNLLIASTSLLAAGAAQGAINYSGLLNYQITGSGAYQLDLNRDATIDYTIRYDAFNTPNTSKPFVDSRTTNPNAWVLSKANEGSPVTLVGTTIDASYAATFPTNRVGYLYEQYDNQTVVGDWSPSGVTDGYVGLELTSGTDVNYGWVHLIYDPTAADPSLTVVDFAYEVTPNTGIPTAEAVPEPATLSLLGLAGLAVLLRRRK